MTYFHTFYMTNRVASFPQKKSIAIFATYLV